MSHSTYLYGADAPVGAGIQKIADDIGAETGPTIGGLVNLIGGAGITVLGNPATNTIEITNTVVASEFQADDANIATPLAGVLAIEGTVHEIETSAPGALHTIKIGLPDDVAIANTLSVPDFLATNDAVITNNFTVGGASYLDAVTVYGAAIFNWGADLGTDPAAVTNISGILTLPDQLNGVLVTDGTGIVSGLAGTDGQLLIGGSGLAPAFASVTAGPGIVITAGPNTLAIETDQDAVATSYIANVGIAIPNGRTITVEGGTNISTSGAFSILTVNLDDSIILAGSATIGTTLTVNGATTLNGAVAINNTLNCANTALFQFPVTFSDNVAMSANLDINGTLNVDSNVTMQSNLDVVHNVSCFQLDVAHDASVGNNLAVGAGFALAASPNGVLQTGGTGIVSATNGTNGQVLIGGGVAPAWGNITSADGSVVVTNGANSIDLSAASSARLAFRAVMNGGVPYAGNVIQPIFVFGKGLALTTIFDTAGAFYPGDGGLAAATFTAPYSGIFNITMKGCLGRNSSSPGLFDNRSTYLRIRNNTSGAYYHILQPATSSVNSAGLTAQPVIANLLYTELIRLNAGDVIQFELEAHGYASASDSGWRVGQDYSGGGTTSISGFLVYRL
jgi:hypothetical protein